MKLSKLLLAGAFAVSAVSTFAADVTVRFTGSTAFRSSTVTAIKDWYTSKSATGVKIVYSSGSLTGANQQGFYGIIGGKSYLITCAWSGSQGGLDAVANKSVVNVANTYTELAITGNGTATGALLATSGNVISVPADVTMADSTQSESGFTNSATYNSLTATRVGVIPFVWVRGLSANSTQQTALNATTNITSLQAQAILNGFAPLSLFTNSQADVGTFVKVVGRNNDSGTRLNTFVEPGFGRDTPPDQYTYTIAGGVIAALDANATGADGYSSGSLVRTGVITPVASGSDSVVFGYMGIGDASALDSPYNNTTGSFVSAQILKFNGVAYSHDAVRNGSYTFWNYENLMHRSNLSGDPLSAVNEIKQIIINADAAVGGIKLGTMNVERNGSGQIISSLN